MRIAVTGRAGQVASCLTERGQAAGHDVLTVGRPGFDLGSTDREAMVAQFGAVRPDVIVSAAAYTAVDRAEDEPEAAFAVNAEGAGRLAEAAAMVGVPLIHLSTDYVFDGSGSRGWREDDPTGPQGIYGASKLAGEQAVLAAQADCAILRTAWVYSPFGANFVKTMLRLAETRGEIAVVADQIGNPTSAFDIADGVLAVAANLLSRPDPALRGVFHMAGAGETSWAGLAEAIFAESARRSGPSTAVRHIPTAEYPTPASRPLNSRLDCSRLAQAHGLALPAWQASLPEVIDRLLGNPDERRTS
jgi:dTDP-4-dehydrorhamnose reductase